MKIFVLLSGLLAFIFAAFLIGGILLSNKTHEQAVIIIEAPQSVVFNTLFELNNYDQWSTLSSSKNIFLQNSTRQVVYHIGSNEISLTEKFSIFPKENILLFTELDSLPGSFIHGLRNRIYLKALADGTCEVLWQTSYSVPTIVGNVLNFLFFKPALRKALNGNIKSLKHFIEH